MVLKIGIRSGIDKLSVISELDESAGIGLETRIFFSKNTGKIIKKLFCQKNHVRTKKCTQIMHLFHIIQTFLDIS
jgi:hypothetical protein